MDEIEITQGQYASFLVRVWHTGEPKADGRWYGEVEHIQNGRRLAFASTAELMELLCRTLVVGDDGLEIVSDT